MKTKLIKLYNTLATVETKGESTKIMADCLRYIEQILNEENERASTADVNAREKEIA